MTKDRKLPKPPKKRPPYAGKLIAKLNEQEPGAGGQSKLLAEKSAQDFTDFFTNTSSGDEDVLRSFYRLVKYPKAVEAYKKVTLKAKNGAPIALRSIAKHWDEYDEEQKASAQALIDALVKEKPLEILGAYKMLMQSPPYKKVQAVYLSLAPKADGGPVAAFQAINKCWDELDGPQKEFAQTVINLLVSEQPLQMLGADPLSMQSHLYPSTESLGNKLALKTKNGAALLALRSVVEHWDKYNDRQKASTEAFIETLISTKPVEILKGYKLLVQPPFYPKLLSLYEHVALAQEAYAKIALGQLMDFPVWKASQDLLSHIHDKYPEILPAYVRENPRPLSAALVLRKIEDGSLPDENNALKAIVIKADPTGVKSFIEAVPQTTLGESMASAHPLNLKRVKMVMPTIEHLLETNSGNHQLKDLAHYLHSAYPNSTPRAVAIATGFQDTEQHALGAYYDSGSQVPEEFALPPAPPLPAAASPSSGVVRDVSHQGNGFLSTLPDRLSSQEHPPKAPRPHGGEYGGVPDRAGKSRPRTVFPDSQQPTVTEPHKGPRR